MAICVDDATLREPSAPDGHLNHEMSAAAASPASSAKTAKPSLSPLMFLPGTLFWIAAGYGIATENETVLGVAVVLLIVVIVSVLVRRGIASAAEGAELARIWMHGDPARATIVRIDETGASFNDHPEVAFTLNVTDRMGRAYEAEARSYVRTIAIPRIQPGCELEVRIDPEDRSRVVLDEQVVYPGYRV